MDLSLECVYPIPEATATGISVLSSQIIGILMVILFPKFGRPLDEHEKLIETCSNDMTNEIEKLDYTSIIFAYLIKQKTIFFDLVPLYSMALIMVAVTLFYISCFQCKYKRRCHH